MHTMKKFIRYYAPYKAVFFLDLICAAVISLVDLAFPQILRTLTKTLFTESAVVFEVKVVDVCHFVSSFNRLGRAAAAF